MSTHEQIVNGVDFVIEQWLESLSSASRRMLSVHDVEALKSAALALATGLVSPVAAPATEAPAGWAISDRWAGEIRLDETLDDHRSAWIRGSILECVMPGGVPVPCPTFVARWLLAEAQRREAI